MSSQKLHNRLTLPLLTTTLTTSASAATHYSVPTKKAVSVKLTAESMQAKLIKMQGTATLQVRYIDKLGNKSGWKNLKSVTTTTTNKNYFV